MTVEREKETNNLLVKILLPVTSFLLSALFVQGVKVMDAVNDLKVSDGQKIERLKSVEWRLQMVENRMAELSTKPTK